MNCFGGKGVCLVSVLILLIWSRAEIQWSMHLWLQVFDVCDVSDHDGGDELRDSPQRVPENAQHSHHDWQGSKGETGRTFHFVFTRPCSDMKCSITLWLCVLFRSYWTSCRVCWGCRCNLGRQTTPIPPKWEMVKPRPPTGKTYSWWPVAAAAPWPSSTKPRNTWWRRLDLSSCLRGSKKETDWWNLY